MGKNHRRKMLDRRKRLVVAERRVMREERIVKEQRKFAEELERLKPKAESLPEVEPEVLSPNDNWNEESKKDIDVVDAEDEVISRSNLPENVKGWFKFFSFLKRR